MGRNKGHSNKDTERVRQEKQQSKGKYKNPTAMRLKEKVTGINIDREAANDFANIYINNYNAC